MQPYVACFPCINAYKTSHISLYAQYSVPGDEHKMLEIYRRQDELKLMFIGSFIIVIVEE